MSQKPLTSFTVPAEHVDLFGLALARAVELFANQVTDARNSVIALCIREADDDDRVGAEERLDFTQEVLAESAGLYATAVDRGTDDEGSYRIEARPAMLADILEVLAQDLAPTIMATHLGHVPIEVEERGVIREVSASMNWALENSIGFRDVAAAASDVTRGGSPGPIS